jgi:hypothetical protein
VTATVRRLPRMLADAVREDGLVRDIFISNMEYVLAHARLPAAGGSARA